MQTKNDFKAGYELGFSTAVLARQATLDFVCGYRRGKLDIECIKTKNISISRIAYVVRLQLKRSNECYLYLHTSGKAMCRGTERDIFDTELVGVYSGKPTTMDVVDDVKTTMMEAAEC